MPKPTKGPRLGGTPTHERIILANLATQLFEHGRITTTETRAKRVQPLAEKLITKAKRGDLHSRRLVLQTVTDPTVVHVLFTEIAPAVAKRDGGCTRITKVGNRKGDNAPMAIIEIVTEEVTPKGKKAEPKRPVRAAATTETVVKAAEEKAEAAEEAAEEATEEAAEAVEEAVAEGEASDASEVVAEAEAKAATD